MAKNMPGTHQGLEMPQEQGADQGGDVQAVGVGIGEYADLVIAQPGQVIAGRIDAQGH